MYLFCIMFSIWPTSFLIWLRVRGLWPTLQPTTSNKMGSWGGQRHSEWSGLILKGSHVIHLYLPYVVAPLILQLRLPGPINNFVLKLLWNNIWDLGQPGAIEMFCLHFWGALMSSISVKNCWHLQLCFKLKSMIVMFVALTQHKGICGW